MNHLPPSPHYGHLKFFQKFAEIFASQGAPAVSTTLPAVPTKQPPISMTPAVLVTKFAARVVDTGSKFATGVVDTGGAP
jgi:hypothetical protein